MDNKYSIVNILLKNAKLNILKRHPQSNMTVLHYAAIGGSFSVIKMVYQHLKSTIATKEKLEQFINYQSAQLKQTALHLACANNDAPEKVVQFLIDQCHANVLIKDSNNKDCLDYARKRKPLTYFDRCHPLSYYIGNLIANRTPII